MDDIADLIARSSGKEHECILRGNLVTGILPRWGWECTCGAKSSERDMTIPEARQSFKEHVDA